jgi:hypothetical protein
VHYGLELDILYRNRLAGLLASRLKSGDSASYAVALLVVIIVKKLFSSNFSVMDDNYDTYKTANIKINQLSLNA